MIFKYNILNKLCIFFRHYSYNSPIWDNICLYYNGIINNSQLVSWLVGWLVGQLVSQLVSQLLCDERMRKLKIFCISFSHYMTEGKILFAASYLNTPVSNLRKWSMVFNLLMHAEINCLIYGQSPITCCLSPNKRKMGMLILLMSLFTMEWCIALV